MREGEEGTDERVRGLGGMQRVKDGEKGEGRRRRHTVNTLTLNVL